MDVALLPIHSLPRLGSTSPVSQEVRANGHAVLSDADADLSTLYRRHARYIGGVVHRLLGDDRDLEDIVQETFVDAMEGLRSLEDPTRVRGWLVTVAVRRVHKVLGRRRRRTWLLSHVEWFSANASNPADRGPVDELYEALDGIAVELRVPWILQNVEHMTLAEISQATNVSVATVKRRIESADERIARRLAP